MSEIIFPQLALPEINWDNPLSEFVSAAVLPRDGVGQDLKNLVTNQVIVLNSAVTWNADGSITSTLDTGDGVLFDFVKDTSIFDDFIYVVDLARTGSNNTSSNNPIFKISNSDYFIEITRPRYNNGFTVRAKSGVSGVSNIDYMGSTFERGFITLHWKGATTSYDIYFNGVLIGQHTQNNDGVDKTQYEVHVGIGGTSSKYYGSQLYTNSTGFSVEQVNEILTNPYQIFKTAEVKREEYALTFDGVDDYVSFPAVTLSGDFNIEFDMWFPNISLGTNGFVLSSNSYNGVNGFGLFYRAQSGSSEAMIQPYTSGVSRINSTAYFMTEDEWHNVKVTRVSGTMQLLIDDVQVGSDWVDSNPLDVSLINGHTGYDNHVIKIKNLLINDITTLANSRLWLFDRKDNPSTINDEYNGAVATLVNSPTFERVIEKQVYTVGTGRDYATAKLYEAGVQLIDAHKVGLVSGDTGETSTVSVVDQVGFFELRAADGEEAKPDGSGAKIGTASISTARSKLLIKNLQLYNYINTGASDATADEEIDGCVIDSGGTANGITFNTNKLTVKNTLIKNCDRGAYSASYRDNTTFLDCVFIDNGDYNCLRANTYNCIATGATTGDYLQTQGDYNVSSDATAVGANSQTNATITLDGDGLIDQTTQDTYLTSKGWNGSDIASSFYAVATGLTRITKDFVIHSTLNERITKDFNITLELLQSVTKDFNTVVDLLTSLQVAKDFQIKVDLAERVVKDFQVTADLLQRATRDHEINVDLLERQIKDFQVDVDLLKRETLDFIINTDFKFRSSKSFIIDVDLLEGVRVSKPFSIMVDFNERVTKTFAIETQLLERVTRNHEIVADLLNRVTMDFMARFDLFERASKDFEVKIDYIERVSKDFNIVVRIDSDIIETTPAHYVINIDGAVEFTDEAISVTFSEEETQHFII